MHEGEPVQFTDWVTVRSVEPVSLDGQEAPRAPPAAALVPDDIANAHETDRTVAWVEDWSSLVEDNGPSARFQWVKGQTLMSMKFVHERMPVFTEKDLGVIHRFNATGAKRTEVWTLRAFKAGELMLAPVTPELKIRMYTHNASVHVDVPKGSVPESRVLALDGRGKTHLTHGNPSQHEAIATGSLFWAMDRTSCAEHANMSLVMCTVYIPEVKVTIPGLPQHTTKLPKDGGMPGVPVLKNLRPLKAHVRLIAMDDPVVAETVKADQKRARAERLAEGQAKKMAKAK